MTTPTPKPGILDIKPYVPGSSHAPGAEVVYKLSSNESALGPSPAAVEASQAISSLELYPDGGSTALREKIAEIHGLNADHIVCGAGSDEILQMLVKAYAGVGDNIVQSDHGFLVYALAAKSCGAEVRFAPEKDLTTDVDALLAQIDANTKIVFVANPNNPTGTYISDDEMRRLRAGMREDILLVIDSAYAEYMECDDYSDGTKIVEENDNVVMTRTFSKIYGLAALRLGWAYCPAAIADVLNRIRGPFNVTETAQRAGIAALGDQEFVIRNRTFNAEQRKRMADALGQMGLTLTQSAGNFLLFKAPDGDASSLQSWLRQRGVIVREMHAYKLAEWLRVSVGPLEANEKFLSLMSDYVGNE